MFPSGLVDHRLKANGRMERDTDWVLKREADGFTEVNGRRDLKDDMV